MAGNIRIGKRPFRIRIEATKLTTFRTSRTTEDGRDNYKHIGMCEAKNGAIIADPPYGSVSNFIAAE